MATDALGQRIAQARKDAGFTQERLAPKIGVSLRTLVRYESGETQRISTETLVAIARATGKRLPFFLGKKERR